MIVDYPRVATTLMKQHLCTMFLMKQHLCTMHIFVNPLILFIYLYGRISIQALFPFQGWWVVPAKVAFDQTIWSAVWNSIYFTVLGFLRGESPANIIKELKETFWPMLTVRNYCFREFSLACMPVHLSCYPKELSGMSS